MAATLWILLICVSLLVAVKTLGESSAYLQRCYYVGVSLWARWLPILATCIYVLLVGSSISDRSLIIRSQELLIANYLSVAELIVLFLVTPFFFTRAGNLAATAVTIYLIERLSFAPAGLLVNSGILMLLSCTTVLAILADKMPWYTQQRSNPSARRFREILLLILAFMAIGVSIATILDVRQFNSWMNHQFSVTFPVNTTLALVIVLLVGWLSIALGFTRHFSLPVVCLPSLFLISYITHWPSYILVVPFAACLALALAIVDRRIFLR